MSGSISREDAHQEFLSSIQSLNFEEGSSSDGIYVEQATVEGVSAKCLRLTMDCKSDFSSLRSLIGAPKNAPLYDTNVESTVSVFLDRATDVEVFHTTMKGSRDVCMSVVYDTFTADSLPNLLGDVMHKLQALKAEDLPEDAHVEPHEVFVVSGSNSEVTAEVSGVTRCSIVIYAYIAFPLSSTLTRLVHYCCIAEDSEAEKESVERMKKIRETSAFVSAFCHNANVRFPVPLRDLQGAAVTTEQHHARHKQHNVLVSGMAGSPQAANAMAHETLDGSENVPAAQHRGSKGPVHLNEHVTGALAKDPQFSKLVGLITRSDWQPSKNPVEGCMLHTAKVDYSSFHALLIATEVNCSLEAFKAVLADPSRLKIYDPKMETLEVLKEGDVSTLYTAYKKESSLIAPRDFVTNNATRTMTPEEAQAEGLTRTTNHHGVVIQSTVSVDGVKPDVKGWVRGYIHACGYLAVAMEPTKIRLWNLCCVDPKGKIPTYVMSAANSDSCKKLAIIRRLCEEEEINLQKSSGGVSLAKDPVYKKAVELIQRHDWAKGQLTEGCQLESVKVSYSAFQAYRISTDVEASLKTIQTVLADESKVKAYDPALEKMEILKVEGNECTLYSAYKKESSMVAPRDFVTLTGKKELSPDDAKSEGIATDANNKGVFIQSTISVDGVKEPVQGWVRGHILVYCYVITALDDKKSRLEAYMCVDPKGSIPTMVMKAVNGENCKKIGIIRGLCEEAEKSQ